MRKLFSPIIGVYKTSKYDYETQETIENIKAKMEGLIENKSAFYKHNLWGNLNKNNSFTLVRRMGLGNINFIDPNPVTLDGRFYYIKEGVTRIKLEVRPNFIFLLFSAIFGIAGVFTFLKSLTEASIEFAALIFILVAPVLCAVAYFSKEAHQRSFENALNLSKAHLINSNKKSANIEDLHQHF